MRVVKIVDTPDRETVRWCVLEMKELIRLLRQVADGDDPDVVALEFVANCTTEKVEPDA